HISTTGSDGKTYEMLCMPLKKLNGWLFSINPEKVRADLKDRVIQYQEECFEALYNYWHFGKAERKTTVDERTGLRDAVNMLVSKKGLIYSEAYQMVHQRFNVNSIEELTPEQLPQAVEYVQRFAIEPYRYEGEWIIEQEKENETVSEDNWLRFASMWFALYNCIDLLAKVEKPLNALGSHFGTIAYTHASEYRNTLIVMQRILEPILAKFEVDAFREPHYYKAIKTLREYNLQGLGRVAKI
ncbi:phage antirepressor N-terminal domain-containing protein, partial [Ursidibacter arcticus]